MIKENGFSINKGSVLVGSRLHLALRGIAVLELHLLNVGLAWHSLYAYYCKHGRNLRFLGFVYQSLPVTVGGIDGGQLQVGGVFR